MIAGSAYSARSVTPQIRLPAGRPDATNIGLGFDARRAFQARADCQRWRGRVEVMEGGERQRVDVLLVTAVIAAQPDLLAETSHQSTHEGNHRPRRETTS